jgi:adenine-specific DNA-methyltransferase
LYIQEKVHPKVLIEDLVKQTKEQEQKESVAEGGEQLDIFGDLNGLPDEARTTDFYQHEANWTNRMILGDSLQVMASLAEREGLRGKVQCIYIDPPYGIKFNSNFQWSTTDRAGTTNDSTDKISREPEQVKAFRDTWRDGIHSYLTYLRDRLVVARDLLSETGSIFVQIGDENVHRVREIMDEILGEDNFIAQIAFAKTSGYTTNFLTGICDYLLWYGKDRESTKFRQPYNLKEAGGSGASKYTRIQLTDGSTRTMTASEKEDHNTIPEGAKFWVDDNFTSQGNPLFPFEYQGKTFSGTYKTTESGMSRLGKASRIYVARGSFRYLRFIEDFPAYPANAAWMDIGGVQSRTDPKIYVVQTASEAIKRCVLMTTDPGDLVIDPTCGSGTTAYVSEQWGRRWIVVDTSRVALALARSRIMGAKFPYYLLSDSSDGKKKEATLSRTALRETRTHGNIRHGFVNERIPHITLKSIANNAEIDVIWEQFQEKLEPLRADLNKAANQKWEEWEIPREAEEDWSKKARKLHADWWKHRIERQREIDASIAVKADFEYLYDRPYEDKSKARVAGPFTVESLTPHRTLGVDENDELIDPMEQPDRGDEADFATMVLDNLKKAGVQQASKEDKINFTSITPWPGRYICAEGRYTEGEEGAETEKRAGIFIGPEFGTVSRDDLVAASRECGEADFDVLISCAFNYEAHAHEFSKLGKVQALKAHMNADLHMGEELANTGKGNLFVVFGEPDIDIIDEGAGEITVKINGVDIFHPNSGEIRSDDTDGIACWFIDTDYNEESFFVRHAYFLGAGDPYKSLKTTLKAEINQEAWETLYSDTSRPFKKPESGRIAVKVINHLGDEVMKVFKVD